MVCSKVEKGVEYHAVWSRKSRDFGIKPMLAQLLCLLIIT
jgi:hypothetical protein